MLEVWERMLDAGGALVVLYDPQSLAVKTFLHPHWSQPVPDVYKHVKVLLWFNIKKKRSKGGGDVGMVNKEGRQY